MDGGCAARGCFWGHLSVVFGMFSIHFMRYGAEFGGKNMKLKMGCDLAFSLMECRGTSLVFWEDKNFFYNE